jgi:hypothetical protein
MITSPLKELSPVSSPWPFTQRGVDLVGPMPTGKEDCKFVVVAVDYFTKWAEAKALASITTGNIRNFLWKSIVCQYGIPLAFIIDNENNSIASSFGNGVQSFISGITSYP